jgi:hypothetical protein
MKSMIYMQELENALCSIGYRQGGRAAVAPPYLVQTLLKN